LGLKRISDLILINEESWRTPEETKAEALYIWQQIKECIYKGVNKEGILPGGLNVTVVQPESTENYWAIKFTKIKMNGFSRL
jgi:L-serine deaminase